MLPSLLQVPNRKKDLKKLIYNQGLINEFRFFSAYICKYLMNKKGKIGLVIYFLYCYILNCNCVIFLEISSYFSQMYSFIITASMFFVADIYLVMVPSYKINLIISIHYTEFPSNSDTFGTISNICLF